MNSEHGIDIDEVIKMNNDLKCCGNCCYYKSHECYCFHNWEPYKKCDGEGKHKWKFAHR